RLHVVEDPEVLSGAIFRFASRLDLGEEIAVLLQMLLQPPLAQPHQRAAEALSHDGQQLTHLVLAELEVLKLADLDLSLRELRPDDARQRVGARRRDPFRIESHLEPLAAAQFNSEDLVIALAKLSAAAALSERPERREAV